MLSTEDRRVLTPFKTMRDNTDKDTFVLMVRQGFRAESPGQFQQVEESYSHDSRSKLPTCPPPTHFLLSRSLHMGDLSSPLVHTLSRLLVLSISCVLSVYIAIQSICLPVTLTLALLALSCAHTADCIITVSDCSIYRQSAFERQHLRFRHHSRFNFNFESMHIS